MRFWRWVLSFALLGLLIPMGLCAFWFLFSGRGISLALWLWPGSIRFMALEMRGAEPIPTVVFVYIVAILENALMYALAGALLWAGMRLAQRGIHALRTSAR